ncbi:MAG: tetratricopeptide repeat protein [Alphaproteobacteria bacterium]|jgi:Flp pilus assembly protein TadD|nr:tetratricopeptide repeat protein [Alphaproteobacteria bacterium]
MIGPLLPKTAIIACLLGLGLAGCTQTPDGTASPSGPGRTGESSVDAGADRVETLMRLGDYTLAGGDTATAISLYRRAHLLEPNAVAPLLRLGASLSRLGSYEQAAGAYRTALEINPGNPEVRRGLGNALIALGRPREALDYLDAAAQSGGADPRLLNSMGVAHDMLGQHDQAQRFYTRGLSQRPTDLTLKSNLALSRSLEGDHGDAIRLARESAAHPQATARHRRTLAMILTFADREGEAADVLRTVEEEGDIPRQLAYFERLKRIPASGDRAAAIGGAGAPAIAN